MTVNRSARPHAVRVHRGVGADPGAPVCATAQVAEDPAALTARR